MIKLLIGGSPCTYWSIAQKNNRETAAEGMGWELFKNYLIAKEKFKPDFFLYENNKSAAKSVKEQIKKELCVTNEGDSNLFTVGAGARYIEINSALVSAQNRQRFYVHNCGDVKQPPDRGILLKDVLVAGQPKVLSEAEMDYMVRDSKGNYSDRWSYLNKPGQSDKSVCITANIRKGVPYNICAEPIRIGTLPSSNGKVRDSQATRIYSIDGKSVCLIGNGGGQGVKTGLYAVPADAEPDEVPVYEVKDGQISIKGNWYPIKLNDGFYIIRKLTVSECCRLQTLPDDYCRAVSNSQAYKGLGNGWTAEVIIHILSEALKDVPKDEPIEVLSMYDGIGTGRYCLDKMGFTNVRYIAYEIDKYAIQIAKSNFPDIIECGDAFQLRNDDWSLP